jgi:hypothetical protein
MNEETKALLDAALAEFLSHADSLRPVVTFAPDAANVSWSEAASASGEVVLLEEGGFELATLGGGRDGSADMRLALDETGDKPALRYSGGFRIRLPEGLLVGADGSRVGGEARGELTITPGEPPSVVINSVRCEGSDFRVGGRGGLLVQSAWLEVSGPVFPLGQNGAGLHVTVAGRVELPAAGVAASVKCTYAGQVFDVRSVGDVELGQGVRLSALRDGAAESPAMRATLNAGGASACHFVLGGVVRIPGGANPNVKVVGHLDVRQTVGGVEVAGFRLAGEAVTELTLPGGVKVKQAQVYLAYDGEPRAFSVNLKGGLYLGPSVDLRGPGPDGASIQARLTYNAADAGDVRIQSSVGKIRMQLLDDFQVSDGELRLDLRTKPAAGEPPVSITLKDGKAGLFRRKGAAATYHLNISGLAASLDVNTQGFVLKLTGGRLNLPEMFAPLSAGLCPNAGGGPSVAIGPGSALKLTYTVGSTSPVAPAFGAAPVGGPNFPNLGRPAVPPLPRLRVETVGAFNFSNIGFEVPQVPGMVAQVCSADLVIAPNGMPSLTNVEGKMRVPLPDGPAQFDLHRGVFTFDGLPSGRVELGQDLPIFKQGGFTLTLLGAGCEECKDARGQSTASGVTVFPAAGANPPRVQLDGGIRLAVPADVLTGARGDQVTGAACGSLTITPKADGTPQLALSLKTISVGGTFHLGGSGGVVMEGAQLTAQGVENVFALSETSPFSLLLSGKILVPGGPGFGIRDAKFVFTDPKKLPGFEPGTLVYEEHQFALAKVLPLRVRKAELTIKEEARRLPLAQMLRPTNLIIRTSATVSIPPDEPYLEGVVDDLVVTFKEDGTPEFTVRGIGMTVGAFDLPPVEAIGGKVYFGGLDSPSTLFFAGNLVGSYEGYKLGVLTAFNLAGPIGAALDFNAGAEGIPVDDYYLGGILITGGSGGISLVNSNEDPCAFTTYLDPDGRPKSSLVSFPVAPMTWQQLRDFIARRKRALKALGAPPLPLPGVGAGPSASGQLVNIRRTPPLESDFGIPCPGDCPPPTVNIFCQPHPDQTKFPNRVIAKFSSFDEAALKRLGISENLVATLAQAAGDRTRNIAAGIASRLRAEMERLIPRPDAGLLGATRAGEIKALMDETLGGIESLFVSRFRDAVGNKAVSREIYEAIRDAAYAGAPCPDVTLKVTGTMTHQFVSSFLSCTGGVVISTTGSAGVVGNLNLLGVPAGKLRGFVCATDAKGDPNPSLCGQVDFEMGPLSLGTLRAGFECDGCVTALLNELGDLAACLTDDLARRIAARVLPNLDARALDKGQIVAALSDSRQKMAFVAGMLAQPPGPQQKECFKISFRDALRAVNPEVLMCGLVQPKLFGMPLATEAVAVAARASKRELIIAVRCSPSALMGLECFAYGNAATLLVGASGLLLRDKALLSFRLELPDGEQAILDTLEGRFRTPADAKRRVEESFDFMLENGVYAVKYELSPLGFKTLDAQWRVLIPDLLNHPARYKQGDPSNPLPWVPPEMRGFGLPSRAEVLAAALDGGRLADPRWKGSPQDLAEVFPSGDPRREKVRNRSLRKDYFPHGGHVGAARLQMPRALAEAPPPELFVILNTNAPVKDRLEAAYVYVKNYLLENVQFGSLTFYVPAPNPPSFVDERGQPLSPRRLLEAMNRFDLGDTAAQKLYPSQLFFLRGYVGGSLLGVPFGQAEIVALPPDPPSRPVGCFRIAAALPQNSWLGQLVEQAGLNFEMKQSPSKTIEERFNGLLARLGQLRQGGTEQAIRDCLSKELLAGLGDGLPKVSLEAKVNLRLPADSPLKTFVQLLGAQPGVNAELFAFSPGYAPGESGEGALARARREGGIAVRLAKLRLGGALGFEAGVDNAELSLTPPRPQQPPRLAGQFKDACVRVGGGALQLNGSLSINSSPGAGEAYLSASGTLSGQLQLAPWLKLSAGAAGLSAGLTVVPGAQGNPNASLNVAPVTLELGGPFAAGATALLHGPTPGERFTFSPGGDWEANVSLSPFTLADDKGRALLRVGSQGQSFKAKLKAGGLNLKSLSVEVPAGVTVTAFPGQPHATTLTGTGAGGALRVDLSGGGRFEVTVTMPPLQVERLIAHGAGGSTSPVVVKIDNSGLRVPSGAQLTVQGVTASPLALGEFAVQIDGSFESSAAGLGISQPDFQLGCNSVTLRRAQGAVTLSLNQARLKITSVAPARPEFTIESLRVASSGEWQYESGQQAVEVPGLFTLRGSIRAGMDAQLRPYVQFKNAALSVACPKIEQAALQAALSAKGITAQFDNWRAAFPNLLETAAGTWTLNYQGGSLFELTGSPGQLTMLGQSVNAGGALTLKVEQGGVKAAFVAPGYRLQLPGIFELSDCQFDFRQENGTVALAVSGTGRALARGDGGWLLQGAAHLSASGPQFEGGIENVANRVLVELPALRLTTQSPNVAFGRDGGGHYLRLAGLTLSLLGSTLNVSAPQPVTADGQVRVEWGNNSFAVGPFTLNSSGFIRFHPARPWEAQIRFHGGTLSSGLSGWSGVNLPGFDLTPDGDFDVTLPSLNLHGMSFASGAGRLKRAGGAVQLEISDTVNFLNSQLQRYLKVDASGGVSGEIRGRVRFGDGIQPPPFTVKFPVTKMVRVDEVREWKQVFGRRVEVVTPAHDELRTVDEDRTTYPPRVDFTVEGDVTMWYNASARRFEGELRQEVQAGGYNFGTLTYRLSSDAGGGRFARNG